ncbi:MAG TPA: hypothetical protein VKU77_33940 [Streptosporangiaceae bacterium]|nr:hypothetical protein [Streptosporangiaceae bacterium]
MGRAPGSCLKGLPHARRASTAEHGPPEDCGGIWVFNEQFADLGDLFTVGDLNERLADLATVLIPAAGPLGKCLGLNT